MQMKSVIITKASAWVFVICEPKPTYTQTDWQYGKEKDNQIWLYNRTITLVFLTILNTQINQTENETKSNEMNPNKTKLNRTEPKHNRNHSINCTLAFIQNNTLDSIEVHVING